LATRSPLQISRRELFLLIAARRSETSVKDDSLDRARKAHGLALDQTTIAKGWGGCASASVCRPVQTDCGTGHMKTPRRGGLNPSQRVGTDDFPAVALAELLAFIGAHRARTMQKLLDVAAGGGRGVEKHDPAGFAAAVLPRVRDVARKERARPGPSDTHLVADLERDLAGEHPGDLVAVLVQMKETLRAGGHGLLEEHDALVGLVTEELERGEAAGRPHVEMCSAAGGHDETFRCVHAGVLSCGTSRSR